MIWLLLGWSEIISCEGYGMKGEKQQDVSVKEDRLGMCHPLGYGVMKEITCKQLAKAFTGQVIYTKGSLR